MKKKVYCDGCLYFKDWINYDQVCLKIVETYLENAIDTPETHYPAKVAEIKIWDKYRKYNKNNSCPHYKHAWWRLWS